MSLNSQQVFDWFSQSGISFFAGVPDSTLKHFCSYVAEHAPAGQHFIAANEGGAVALASGYYLSTGQPALVYMQNSGLGNAVNPLTSLADPEVYQIPMVLMIGWRGEPGVGDEPQHIKQGRITLGLLDTLGIPHSILPDDPAVAESVIRTTVAMAQDRQAPCALIVRQGTFEKYGAMPTVSAYGTDLLREQAIQLIISHLSPNDVVVATTGMTSRELFECREATGQGHQADFLTVGSMGHASQIALGIATLHPQRAVYCLDGDGAAIMHLGSLAIIGSNQPTNFRHVVINNGAHESVGGQPTAGLAVSLPNIATACGYRFVQSARTESEVRTGLQALASAIGPAFLEVVVRPGHRPDLGRPTTTPADNKLALMGHLGATSARAIRQD